MWVMLVGYVIGLAAHRGTSFEPGVDGVLGLLTTIVPAVVCWAAVGTAGPRRREVTCLALGVSAYAAGAIVLVGFTWSGSSLPYPSLADLFYGSPVVSVGAV